MMSSEEESKCLGLFGDKLLKKRQRQRVDAGEPRNSYSSIPNFSSRPNFLSGSPYDQLFAQSANAQHIGFLSQVQSFGSAKMLNELLGRQVKTATEANAMETVSVGDMNINMDCYNSNLMIRRSLEECQDNPELAHHMLRDILQGRKKDLMALEEMQSAEGEHDPVNNNNTALVNNNQLKNGDSTSSASATSATASDASESVSGSASAHVPVNAAGASGKLVNGAKTVSVSVSGAVSAGASACASAVDQDSAAVAIAGAAHSALAHSADNSASASASVSDSERMKRPTDANSMDIIVNGDQAADSDSEGSVHSTTSDLRSPKDGEDDLDLDDDKKSSEHMDLKRKRVENIVSTMTRASPLPAVNGCKKRKLYHPQQHDAGLGVAQALGMQMQALMMEDADEGDIRQKRVEKNVLKSQLRNMQEKLAEMQHQYVQLCSRMDQESTESQEADDNTSDIDQDAEQDGEPDAEPEHDQEHEQEHDADQDQDQDQDQDPDNSLSLSDKTGKEDSPPSTPAKDAQPSSGHSAPVTPRSAPSPVLKQMAPPKIQPHHGNPPMFPPHPMHLALLQQQQQQQQQQQHLGHDHPAFQHHPHHPQHHPGHPHPSALSSAAAMYLGVSHKLFMEQEARLAKEAAAAAERQHQENMGLNQRSREQQPHPHALQHAGHPQVHPQGLPQGQGQHAAHHQKEFSERFAMFRSAPVDLEGLADILKSEISTSVASLVDSILSRYVQQRRFMSKQSEVEQLNKDLLLASQLLDRKSPRTKVIDRLPNGPSDQRDQRDGRPGAGGPRVISAGGAFPGMPPHPQPSGSTANGSNNSGTPNSLNQSGNNPNTPENNLTPHDRDRDAPEQNEALSLVVTTKKKRHKVTDTRITPRTVSRILAQDGMGPPMDGASTPQLPGVQQPPHPAPAGTPGQQQPQQPPTQQQQAQREREQQVKYGMLPVPSSSSGSESPPPSQRPYHPPPPMLPVSLPTSVAIPNPGLHESQVFSPYSPFYSHAHGHAPHMSASPPLPLRDSPPPLPPLLHPALMAAAHHAASAGASPDYVQAALRGASQGMDSLDRLDRLERLDRLDRGSDCNSGDGPYDGLSPSISFSYRMKHDDPSSLTGPHSSTLTPMHLRKAKLMFFWVRYPSSAVLKMYFPDIKFNKNNTAQLVKWFSNFREFYYIQMEKYARQAVSEGVKTTEELHVLGDSEIYRVLNLHYNRNNHIEVPQNFRYVVEQTLKEFYRAIQGGKDTEPSWKKAIYKVISRMDDPVPEYFKSPNFLEQLE